MEVHPCSICQKVIMESMERALSKLKCGHRFHLDCIGTVFNATGVMRCPNCGNVVNGEWIYAQGRRPDQGTNRHYDFDSAGDLGSSQLNRPYRDSATRAALRARDLESYVQQASNQRRAGSSSDQPQGGGSARQSHG